jgi:putative addiction module killer protein
LDRLAYGLTGDVKPVGGGISELRIHYGPGYRVYFQRRGYTIIVVPRQKLSPQQSGF